MSAPRVPFGLYSPTGLTILGDEMPMSPILSPSPDNLGEFNKSRKVDERPIANKRRPHSSAGHAALRREKSGNNQDIKNSRSPLSRTVKRRGGSPLDNRGYTPKNSSSRPQSPILYSAYGTAYGTGISFRPQDSWAENADDQQSPPPLEPLRHGHDIKNSRSPPLVPVRHLSRPLSPQLGVSGKGAHYDAIVSTS